MESVTLTAKDGYQLRLSVFESRNAKGCIQLIHGMEEHKDRYEDFAQKLRQMGYTVVTSNMRGHGIESSDPVFFREEKGAKYLLLDQMLITRYIKERFGVEKVNLFAHSMGTIITRNLLQTHSLEYEKVVLSGCPCYPGKIQICMGRFLSRVIGKVKGPEYFSRRLQNMSVSSFNRSIENPETELDWLSYDKDNIKNYQEDPRCGQGFSISAFYDLFTLVERMNHPKNYENVNSRLPILILCGEDDPCTGFEQGIQKSAAVLKSAGFADVRTKTYEKMRHEILNEKEHEKVYADIIAFYMH